MPSEIKKWKLSIFGCTSVSGIGSTIYRIVLCVHKFVVKNGRCSITLNRYIINPCFELARGPKQF